jgi:hypothetical protein
MTSSALPNRGAQSGINRPRGARRMSSEHAFGRFAGKTAARAPRIRSNLRPYPRPPRSAAYSPWTNGSPLTGPHLATGGSTEQGQDPAANTRRKDGFAVHATEINTDQ